MNQPTHSLVNAFKSTLEEAQHADVILLVLDASDEHAESQYATVVSVLEEIGAEHTPRIVVLNKTDTLTDDAHLAELRARFPDAVPVSAKTHTGFDALLARMQTLLTTRAGDSV